MSDSLFALFGRDTELKGFTRDLEAFAGNRGLTIRKDNFEAGSLMKHVKGTAGNEYDEARYYFIETTLME